MDGGKFWAFIAAMTPVAAFFAMGTLEMFLETVF